MTTIPESTSVLDAGQQAANAGLHLICNGFESRISPIVPPGWFRMAVKVKPTDPHTPGGELPCAE